MPRKRKVLENCYKVLLIQADVHSELEPNYKVKKVSTAKPFLRLKRFDQGDLDFIETVKDFEDRKMSPKIDDIVNSDSEESFQDILRQSKQQSLLESKLTDKKKSTSESNLRLKSIDALIDKGFEDIDFSYVINRKKLQRQAEEIIPLSDSDSEDVFAKPRVYKNVTKPLEYSSVEIEQFCNVLSSTKDEVTIQKKQIPTVDSPLSNVSKKQKTTVDEDFCSLLSSTKDEVITKRKHIKPADFQLKTDASMRKRIVESHSSEDFFDELFSNTRLKGVEVKEERKRHRGKKNVNTGSKSTKKLFEIGLSLLVDAFPLIQKLSIKYNCKDELRKLKEALNSIEE